MADELTYTADPNNPCQVTDNLGRVYNYCPPANGSPNSKLPNPSQAIPLPSATIDTIGKLKACLSGYNVRIRTVALSGVQPDELAPANEARVRLIVSPFAFGAALFLPGMAVTDPPLQFSNGQNCLDIGVDDYGPLVQMKWLGYPPGAVNATVIEILANK